MRPLSLILVTLIAKCCRAIETPHLRHSATSAFDFGQKNRQLNACFDGLCSDDSSYVSSLDLDCNSHAPWVEKQKDCYTTWLYTPWMKYAYDEQELFDLIGTCCLEIIKDFSAMKVIPFLIMLFTLN